MSVRAKASTCASQIVFGALSVVFFAVLSTSLLAEQFVLKKGTNLKMILVTELSSETANIGDPVEFKVAEDVKDSCVLT